MAYLNYYTHRQAKRNSFFQRLHNGYRQKHYGYPFSDSKGYEKFLRSFLAKMDFFRESMDYPFSFLNMPQHDKLLGLGAGNGEILKQPIEWGWSAQGIDFSPKAVATCKAENLEVQLGDLESRCYPNNEFNAIHSSNVLVNAPNPISLIKESLRILDQEGIFVGVTPNGRSSLYPIFKINGAALSHQKTFIYFIKNPCEVQRIKWDLRMYE